METQRQPHVTRGNAEGIFVYTLARVKCYTKNMFCIIL